MKIKLYIFLKMFILFLIILTSCILENESQDNYRSNIMPGEKYLEVNLIESQSDEKVTAEINLIKKPNIQYDYAILYIMDDGHGLNSGDKFLIFDLKYFGKVTCKVIFIKKQIPVFEIEQEIDFNIQTFFTGVGANESCEYAIENGQNFELFSRPRARGNNDICFILCVRVPVNQELTINHTIVGQSDPRPKYNQTLEVHYRGIDYRYRNDLYIPPDEAMYHIDIEIEKWIYPPLILGHGVHRIYIAPSCVHDLSYLVVTMHNENFVSTASGFFKTIF